MTTPEPWAVGDISTNVTHHSTTTATLSAEIKVLTAFKSIVEFTPAKAIFESVIVVLTLVRVSFLVPFPFSYLLISGMTRTR